MLRNSKYWLYLIYIIYTWAGRYSNEFFRHASGHASKALDFKCLRFCPRCQDVVQTTPIVHVETTPIVNVEPNDVAAGEKTDDVVMGDTAPVDTPAHKPQNDVNLPPWLTAMIQYLRGVAKDVLWQNLVMELVEFEKSGPPNGICSLIIFF